MPNYNTIATAISESISFDALGYNPRPIDGSWFSTPYNSGEGFVGGNYITSFHTNVPANTYQNDVAEVDLTMLGEASDFTTEADFGKTSHSVSLIVKASKTSDLFKSYNNIGYNLKFVYYYDHVDNTADLNILSAYGTILNTNPPSSNAPLQLIDTNQDFSAFGGFMSYGIWVHIVNDKKLRVTYRSVGAHFCSVYLKMF